MKKPKVWCPACKELYHKVTWDEWVVVCSIIYDQFEQGQSNFENYTIVPSHCEEGKYEKCNVWRGNKEKDWARKEGGRYSSLEQAEKIRL
jgi:hypothetical protein